MLYWIIAAIIGLQYREVEVERDEFVLNFLDEGGDLAEVLSPSFFLRLVEFLLDLVQTLIYQP